MDRYVAMAGSSKLKTDALEFLVWDHFRLGHQSQSTQRAKELLAISPGNPIAVAVLNQDMSSAPRDKGATANRLAQLNSAMSSLDQLSKPEGMLDRNFQMLKQQVAIMLNGAVGLSYLAIEDYPQARMALEQAVASDPNNAQLVYGMGLALLNGKNRDQYRGYWYLARAANLTAGTPQGQEINNYAWRAYVKDGGKAEGWQRYQASAAALDAPPNPDTGKPSGLTAWSHQAVPIRARRAILLLPPIAQVQPSALKSLLRRPKRPIERSLQERKKRLLVLKIRCMSRLRLNPRHRPTFLRTVLK